MNTSSLFALFSRPSKSRHPRRRNRRLVLMETLERKVLLAADLAVQSSDGDVTAQAGDTITYSYDYANLGDEAASGVVLFTQAPMGTSFDPENSSDDWECRGVDSLFSACRLEIGDLAEGDTGTAKFSVILDGERLPHRLDNVVRIQGADFHERNLTNNIAHETTPVAQDLADLQVSLDDGDVEVGPGDSIEYSISYSNVGTAAASNVVLKQYVPAFSTFDASADSEDWNCEDTRSGAACTLDIGMLEPGDGGEATFVVRVNEQLPIWVTRVNAFSYIVDRDSHGRDADPRNNRDWESTPIVQEAVDLTLTIDDGGEAVAPGEALTYSLTYANQGSADATGVVITQRLSPNTTVNADGNEGWKCGEQGRFGTVCTFDVGALAAGESFTTQLMVTVSESLRPGVRRIVTAAKISAAEADRHPFNNFAYAWTQIARDDADGENGLFGRWARR